MKTLFRQSMTWLHSWLGLLLGWLLFAIFLTGTAAYFRPEITHWMQPELQPARTPMEQARSALDRLGQVAANSPQWYIDLPDERSPASNLLWRVPGPERRFEREILDPASGQKVTTRDTLGGDFLYRFHFQFHLPPLWGRILAGVAAMALFLALITGIIAHRHFFADFFTFRTDRKGLRPWLDFHNLCGVLALPFYVMISYSALVIFAGLYMPWGRQILTEATVQKPVGSRTETRPTPSQTWVAPASMEPMLEAAQKAWGSASRGLKRIEVSNRGTALCEVTLVRNVQQRIPLSAVEKMRFNGVTGEQLAIPAMTGGIATTARDFLYGLHVARFASPGLRWLFLVMGLMGTALVGTGLVLWTLKRRNQTGTAAGLRGLWLVERLNIACIAGMPLAIAAFFWANRLLPLGMKERADWEIAVFFGVWALALLHPLLRPVMSAWKEQLIACSAAFLTLPLGDALCEGRPLLQALHSLNKTHIAFDAAMICCGLLCLTITLRLRSPMNTGRPNNCEGRHKPIGHATEEEALVP